MMDVTGRPMDWVPVCEDDDFKLVPVNNRLMREFRLVPNYPGRPSLEDVKGARRVFIEWAFATCVTMVFFFLTALFDPKPDPIHLYATWLLWVGCSLMAVANKCEYDRIAEMRRDYDIEKM